MAPQSPSDRLRRFGFHSLRIEALGLRVRLGCGDAERATAQDVRFGAELRFAEPPAGVVTDDLGDTVCYSAISDVLRELCEVNEFRLLEHLAGRAYEAVRKISPDGVLVVVSVTKVRPPVENLDGGATYVCGDFCP